MYSENDEDSKKQSEVYHGNVVSTLNIESS